MNRQIKCLNSRRLKITFLDFDDIRNPLLGAGQAWSTFHVGKELAKKGHKISVISSKYPGCRDRFEGGIEYKHIGFTTNNIKLNNLIYILSIPFIIPKVKADIIIECFTAPISTLFSPLFTKVPVIAKSTSFEAERFTKLYHLPFNQVEKFGCRFYKYFMPLSPNLEKKMKSFNRNITSFCITEGVDKEYFSNERKSPNHLLYLGRLDINQKGIDLLLESYNKIKGSTSIPLVISGDGPDKDKVKALIHNWGLDNQVKMVGPVHGKEKQKLLSHAYCLVFPSRQESFGLVGLEALASGIPIVCFDIPGLAWLNKKVAFKVKPFAVSQYSKLLLRMTDRKNIKRMSSIYRAYAKKFTWNKIADMYEEFFMRVLRWEGGI